MNNNVNIVMTKLELEYLLLEIKSDLILGNKLYGTSQNIVLAIKVVNIQDFTKIKGFKKLMIDLDFMGVHIIGVNIPAEHAQDKLFIRHQIVSEMCRYFDIIKSSIERINEVIFPYQHKLLDKWKEQVAHL